MPDNMESVHTRAIPVQHAAAHTTYVKILRGLHYRHEFARRNRRVANAAVRVLHELHIDEESASSFCCENGLALPEVIVQAYRSAQRRKTGSESAELLRAFFIEFGVLPLPPEGSPFLPVECARYVTSPTDREIEAAHAVVKRVWNALLRFEVFAVAEFKLPRPIMLPVLPLSRAATRNGVVDLAQAIAPTTDAYPVYLDTSQPMDVIRDYVTAIVEQTREGKLVTPGRKGQCMSYVKRRVHFDRFDFYLKAYDISRSGASEREADAMKRELLAASEASDKKKQETNVEDPFRRVRDFYRGCLDQACALVESYRDIV